MNENITEIVDLNHEDNYRKHNIFISSIYKASKNFNRVLAIAFSRINEAEEDLEGSLIIKLRAAEIKKILGVAGNGIYSSLNEIAIKMVGGITVGVTDSKNNRFAYVPMITKVAYDEGILTIRFAPEMKEYLRPLSNKYTTLSLSTMLSFDSVYSMRLYEILKSVCYVPDWKNVKNYNKFKYEISLAQLKLMMGFVNSELSRVKKILTETSADGKPNYEKAVKVADEKEYNEWDKFKTVVLNEAINEINEKSELNIEYEPIRAGKGGKVKSIIFYIVVGSNENEEILDNIENVDILKTYPTEDDMLDAIMTRAVSKPIKIAEARALAKAANNDVSEIIKADRYVQSLNKEPHDYIAYMVDTIKYKYYKKKEYKKKDIDKKISKEKMEDMLCGD